jgi:hypothetical protein
MNEPWIARRYKTTDKEKIFKLYDIVHGKTKGEICRKNWDWEYECNPCNSGGTHVWVAECGGKIVSMHAAIPAIIKCGNEELRASWSVDLMTHPDYRFQGIFNEVTNKMLEDSHKEGITLFLVLPNDNSYAVLKKRGWFQITTVPHMIKLLRAWPLLKQATIRNLPKLFIGGLIIARHLLSKLLVSASPIRNSSIKISKIRSFDNRVTDFFQETAKAYNFIVIRNKEYLNWRYAGHPHRKYTIFLAEKNDILATQEQKTKNGFIVDFLTKPIPNQEEVIELLLLSGIRHLQQENVTSIELCALHNPYDNILKKYGFTVFPEKFFWGYDLIGHIESSEDFFTHIKDPRKKWLITMGDADSDIVKG